jgi:hypothetical protein
LQQHALAANALHLCLHGRRALLVQLWRGLRRLFGIELRWVPPLMGQVSAAIPTVL